MFVTAAHTSMNNLFRPIKFKQGSVVLIQGASSGLGKEMAKRYAQRDCPVMCSGRNEAELKSLVEHCRKEYGNEDVHYKVAEATSEADAKALVEFTMEKFGRIDILVLAAGIASHTSFKDMKNMEDFKKIIDVNVMGYVNLTRHALEPIRNTKG